MLAWLQYDHHYSSGGDCSIGGGRGYRAVAKRNSNLEGEHSSLEALYRHQDLLPADGSEDVSLLAGWHCMKAGNGSAMGPLFHNDGVETMTTV